MLNLKYWGTDTMGTGGDVATDHAELSGYEHSFSSRKLHKSGKDEVSSVNSVNWATEPTEKGRIFTAEGISKTQAE